MVSYNNFYEGATYSTQPPSDINYGEPVPAAAFSLATDPRTANQLKDLFDKLRTGAKNIELSPIQPEVLESIPKQHFEELNRLRKLAGAELTLHGPIVEASGVTKQGWDPSHREQSERQMFSAVEKAHDLDPKGNVVVTFHASALPELRTRVMEKKGGKEVESVRELWVVDDEGKFAQIVPKENPLTGEKADVLNQLKEQNKELWSRSLSQASFHANSGFNAIKDAVDNFEDLSDETKKMLIKESGGSSILDLYKLAQTPKGQQIFNLMKEKDPKEKQNAFQRLNELNHGMTFVKDAYFMFQDMFRKAYKSAEESAKKGDDKDLARLKSFAENFQSIDKKAHLTDLSTFTKEPQKMKLFAEKINEGVNLLNAIKIPQSLKPMDEFVIDKSSETFSNIAFDAYKEFKNSAPIISIENPPVGTGISHAEDLAKLIEETKKKFVEKARKEGLSESEAKEQADKIIGATWDVGHINMLRKYGYSEKQLVEQTKKISPFLKHIHLSDNFGMEHTELPMGMGNVPTAELMKALGDKAKKAKKVIETGNWYQYFQVSPFKQTLQSFGSPLYAMEMAPVWKGSSGITGGYFAGRGMLPEVHYSMYGAGFSGLPYELGGQVGGGGRKSVSGAPIE
jgi:sugar phosphate isomerase/epimerase